MDRVAVLLIQFRGGDVLPALVKDAGAMTGTISRAMSSNCNVALLPDRTVQKCPVAYL